MAKLKHVTFTGIDAKTDIVRLIALQHHYPFVEWGVLISKNWKENGPRYFNPDELWRLAGLDLNLSCHVCGSAARAAIEGNWLELRELTGGRLSMFQRCQINIGAENLSDKAASFVFPSELREVIIQQKDASHLEAYEAIRDKKSVSILLDASGGLGLNTPIIPLSIPRVKIGYAGGINEHNVRSKLEMLLNSPLVEEFWIDMESGVRTDDFFDLDKVVRVLKVCEDVLGESFTNTKRIM